MCGLLAVGLAAVYADFTASIDRDAALPDAELSCHARDGLDLSGDAAYVWGLGFHVTSAAACCAACAAHARICSQPQDRHLFIA